MFKAPGMLLSSAATTAVAATCAWVKERAAVPSPTTGTFPAFTWPAKEPPMA